MRTNIVLDDELLAEVAEIAGTQTKRATVEWAMREIVRQQAMRDLAAMRGTVDIDPEDVRPGRVRSKRHASKSA